MESIGNREIESTYDPRSLPYQSLGPDVSIPFHQAYKKPTTERRRLCNSESPPRSSRPYSLSCISFPSRELRLVTYARHRDRRKDMSPFLRMLARLAPTSNRLFPLPNTPSPDHVFPAACSSKASHQRKHPRSPTRPRPAVEKRLRSQRAQPFPLRSAGQ